MTDLTASKPLDHSADEADVDPQGVTDGERAVEDTSNSTESELVLTL